MCVDYTHTHTHTHTQEVKADDPRQKEADNLFTTIDSMGDRNGSLELFEIILYMQVRYAHMNAPDSDTDTDTDTDAGIDTQM
jgi:hypothetical protein